MISLKCFDIDICFAVSQCTEMLNITAFTNFVSEKYNKTLLATIR
jgi:hypothetical protein